MNIFVNCIRLFILILPFTQLCGLWGQTDNIVQTYNHQQLTEFKNALKGDPASVCAVILDLHDVLFDRLSGDFERAKALGFWGTTKFLCNLAPFGSKYLAYKMGFAYHPNIELHVTDLSNKNFDQNLLQLISPFKLNAAMADWCQNCSFPLFACSNIGQQSYDFLNGRFNFDKLFKGKQIATPENGYLQKDRKETYNQLYATMQKALGAAPTVLFMIDDRKSNILRCKEVLESPTCKVFGFVFTTYEDFSDMLKTGKFEGVFA